MSIYEHYKASIVENLNLPNDQLNFKSDPRYQYVLEHVDARQGKEYLDLVKKEFSDFYEENKNSIINLCKKNDSYGRPVQSYFFDFCSCSPTNLRYLYQSLLILKYMKDINLTSAKVIEIGGGYGGLCLFVKTLAKYFNIQIDSYIIYDLEEAEILQQKYLRIHGVNLTDQNKISEGSFLISNYAFSELPEELRKEYEEKVINKYCDCGFLAWNACPLYQFIEGKTIKNEAERPSTSPNNLYVYFK